MFFGQIQGQPRAVPSPPAALSRRPASQLGSPTPEGSSAVVLCSQPTHNPLTTLTSPPVPCQAGPPVGHLRHLWGAVPPHRHHPCHPGAAALWPDRLDRWAGACWPSTRPSPASAREGRVSFIKRLALCRRLLQLLGLRSSPLTRATGPAGAPAPQTNPCRQRHVQPLPAALHGAPGHAPELPRVRHASGLHPVQAGPCHLRATSQWFPVPSLVRGCGRARWE